MIWLSNCRWLAGSRDASELAAPELFVRELPLREFPKTAIWRVSARGLVAPRINGREATDEQFLPGWTDYRKRIPVREFNVATLLCVGKNTLEITLASGWYCGRISRGNYPDGRLAYGTTPSWAGELVLTFSDGRQQIITSNSDWRYAEENHLLFSDIYAGEKCDFCGTFPAAVV